MCGIFGKVSQEPKKFDYTAFCTLGIHNDIRGGDSCGVFIDGEVEYGVDKNKLFEDFLETSKLVQETKTCRIALGHDRKASVGAINEKTAQPVVLYDANGKAEFVVIHNGTIYNYEALAAKYIPDIDIKGMTDSQVMTRIFYYKGYNVLSEYNGGAVFVIVDYREKSPKVLFWRGESPTTYNGVAIEERPLYIALCEDELWFSSIYTFLPVLRRNAKVVQLIGNSLCGYDGKELYLEKEYSREGQVQYNRGTYSNTTNSTTNSTIMSYNTNVEHIYCSSKDGKCFRHGTILHGAFKSDIFGNINSKTGTLHEMWFWNGTLLKNKQCFDYLSSLARELGCTPQDIDDIYKELPLFLSPYPYLRNKEGEIEIADSPISSKLYTGDYYFPFTVTCVTVKEGKQVSQKVKTVAEGMATYFSHLVDKVPYTELCNNFGIILDDSY